MHSNSYTFMYAAGISLITAVLLSLLATGLKPMQEKNEALDTKKNLLMSVRVSPESNDEIEKIYAERVNEIIINGKGEVLSNVNAEDIKIKEEVNKPVADRTLVLYEYTEDGKKKYVMPMRGVGLWGPIWGYLALEDDFNTVYGATFDHKGETPGLGAEIAERFFQEQFEGKKIKAEGEFVSVRVVKKGVKTEYGEDYQVDGISGGTITSNGTDKMIENCVEAYLPYFSKIDGKNKLSEAKN